MDHETDVRAIDAHAEGDGGDDDVHALAQECVLVRLALRVREAGVIRQGRDADARQPSRKRIDLLPREAVDDARLGAMAAEHLLQLALQRGPGQHAVEKVGPVERSDELRWIVQRELCGDIAPDPRRGRRGVGMEANARKQLPQACQLAILRPEVMPPVADAVRLVDRHEADAARRQQRQEAFAAVAHEPFRREIQQTISSLAQAGDDRGLLAGAERAVVQRRRDAVADEGIDLILHQGDQRRDDQREPRLHHGRRLEAERLAAARGENDERIAAGQDRFHRIALERSKGGVSPVARERSFELRCTHRATGSNCSIVEPAADPDPPIPDPRSNPESRIPILPPFG